MYSIFRIRSNMKKIVWFLTSIIFLIISLAGFFHALDMKLVGHDMNSMTSMGSEDILFCSKSTSNNTKWCFQEIPESKWIQNESKKILEIFVITFLSIFFVGSFSIIAFRQFFNGFLIFKYRSPPRNSYLSLYWIIRNLN